MLTNNYFNYKSWDFENPISTTMIGIIDLYDFVVFFLILILWSVIVVFCVSSYYVYSNIILNSKIILSLTPWLLAWHKNCCNRAKILWFMITRKIFFSVPLFINNLVTFFLKINVLDFRKFKKSFSIFLENNFGIQWKFSPKFIVFFTDNYGSFVHLFAYFIRIILVNNLFIFSLSGKYSGYFNIYKNICFSEFKPLRDSGKDSNIFNSITLFIYEFGIGIIKYVLISRNENSLNLAFGPALSYQKLVYIYTNILRMYFHITKIWYICFKSNNIIYNKKFILSIFKPINEFIYRKKTPMLVKLDIKFNYLLGWKKQFFSPFFELLALPKLYNKYYLFWIKRNSKLQNSILFYINIGIIFMEFIVFFLLNFKYKWRKHKFLHCKSLSIKGSKRFFLSSLNKFFTLFKLSNYFWDNITINIISKRIKIKFQLYDNKFWKIYDIFRNRRVRDFKNSIIRLLIIKKQSKAHPMFTSHKLFLEVTTYFFERLNIYRTSSFLYNNATVEFIWISIPAILLLFMAIPSLLLIYSIDEWTNPLYTIIIVGNQWFWSYEYSNICLWGLDNFLYKLMLSHYGKDLELLTALEWHTILNQVYIKLDIHKSLVENSSIVHESNLPFGYPRLLTTDNVLLLPSHTSMRLLVTSSDVIHSWAVPDFGIKIDAVPGRLNQVFFSSNFYGTSWGQCSELCGVHHAFMPIEVRVVPLCIFEKFLDYHFNSYLNLIINELQPRLGKILSFFYFVDIPEVSEIKLDKKLSILMLADTLSSSNFEYLSLTLSKFKYYPEEITLFRKEYKNPIFQLLDKSDESHKKILSILTAEEFKDTMRQATLSTMEIIDDVIRCGKSEAPAVDEEKISQTCEECKAFDKVLTVEEFKDMMRQAISDQKKNPKMPYHTKHMTLSTMKMIDDVRYGKSEAPADEEGCCCCGKKL